MPYIVEEPRVQNLGMQGEHLLVKIVFPIVDVESGDINNLALQAVQRAVGSHAVILKMRAEDLPTCAAHCETVHFNIGRALQEQFGPYCKACGTKLTREALCGSETCPFSDHLQNWVAPPE